jgi:hypothetical protein
MNIVFEEPPASQSQPEAKVPALGRLMIKLKLAHDRASADRVLIVIALLAIAAAIAFPFLVGAV